MQEKESKRYTTSFGRVTTEDYENDRHRDFSLRADKLRQNEAPKKRKKKTSVKGLDFKTLIRDLILPDGLSRSSQSGQGLDSAERSTFGNVAIVVCVGLLILFGLVMITSSSYYYCYFHDNDPFYNLKRQLVNLAVGLFFFAATRFIPLKVFQKLSFFAYIGSVALCVVVLIWGNTANGSTRWLTVFGTSFQPSETAKLAVALYMAALVEKFHDKMKDLKVFVLLLVILLVPVCLVAVENLSTAIIIALIGFSIMIVGGSDFWHCVCLILIGIVLVIGFIAFTAVRDGVNPFTADFAEWGYRAKRILAWLNPWEDSSDKGYQLVQSLYAVGSGGFFGRGLGESIQKLGFIPEAYNDIIFSIICEELGLLGAGLVIALFIVFTYQGYTDATKNPTLFGSGLITGLTTMVSAQAVINIGVAVGALPTTGASLPFISYGGSSAVFLLAGVGLMLSASRYRRKTLSA